MGAGLAGLEPVGGPIVGWVGQDAGARWALVLGGLAAVLSGAVALAALTRIGRRAAARQQAASGQPAAAASLLARAARPAPRRRRRVRPGCPVRRPPDR